MNDNYVFIKLIGNHDSEWTLLEEKMSGKSTTVSECYKYNNYIIVTSSTLSLCV